MGLGKNVAKEKDVALGWRWVWGKDVAHGKDIALG